MKELNISKESFKANKKFYDDKNFPRGLSRSGDFTLSEVQILESYGIAFQDLMAGKQVPINDDESRFISVCNGEVEASTKVEKTWLKYQNKILSPKHFHTLFGRTKVEADAEDEPVSIDIDEE